MSNPNTDVVVLTALGNVIWSGTALAAMQAVQQPIPPKFYVHDKASMSRGAFPALHLSAGPQVHREISTSHFTGTLLAVVEYYDRWDARADTIDTIRKAIAADLEIMRANAMHNSSLVYNNVAHNVSIPHFSFSSYKGEIDAETVPGVKLVYRTMTLSISIPPYDEM
jgi:hypothetical protein